MRAYKVNDDLVVNIDAIAAVQIADGKHSVLLIGGAVLSVTAEDCAGIVGAMTSCGSSDKSEGEVDPENLMDYFRKGKFSMDTKNLNAKLPESDDE